MRRQSPVQIQRDSVAATQTGTQMVQDASVVAISGILHQEQEWNGTTVLRPIAYVSNVCSGHIRDSWRSTAHT